MNLLIASLTLAAIVGVGSPLMADSTTTTLRLDVTTSEVAEDLRAFYHDKYPTNTLASLVPHKTAGDEYDDFKLINLYAQGGDLYVYFFSGDYRFQFDSIALEYSDSTALAADSTSIVENWHLGADAKTGNVMNHNGTTKRFYKAVCKSFYTYAEGSEHRVKAKNLILKANGASFSTRDCENHDYSWKDQANGEDQVYSYFKNNYVVLDDMTTVLNPIATKYENFWQDVTTEAQEMNWLFFSYSAASVPSGFDLGKVVGVKVDYDYLTYENTYRCDTGVHRHTSVYGGLYEDAQAFAISNAASSRDFTFTLQSSARAESTVKPSNRTLHAVTDKASIFGWDIIHHEVNYSYQTLQALDDSSVDSIKDPDFAAFINRHRASYMYAINFKNDYRMRLESHSDIHSVGDFVFKTEKVTSICHECRDVDIVSLTFDSEAGELTLNGLSKPVESPSLDTTQPSNTTVFDMFNNGLGLKLKRLWIAGVIIAGVVLLGYLGFLGYRYFHGGSALSKQGKGAAGLLKNRQQKPNGSDSSKPIHGQWPKGK